MTRNRRKEYRREEDRSMKEDIRDLRRTSVQKWTFTTVLIILSGIIGWYAYRADAIDQSVKRNTANLEILMRAFNITPITQKVEKE